MILMNPVVAGDSGKPLSKGAQQLINQAFKNIPENQFADFHVHILGLQKEKNGAFVHPEMKSLWHPIKYIQFKFYKNAAGITDQDNADQQYIANLLKLTAAFKKRGHFYIMAFDHHYLPDGTIDLEKTEFYVPNTYIMKISKQYPNRFKPIISIHPYRLDAIKALEKWSKQGAKLVKWLPNSMGIDPADPKIIPFYKKMGQLNMTLITHTGEEKAVDAEAYQRLGNPLRLTNALKQGVNVIMAHAASLGQCKDLEHPQQQSISCFKLFIRMMDKPKYQSHLFGELSAITQINRNTELITTLLDRQDLHHRLVNGSDYPLPAINLLTSTWNFWRKKFLTSKERKYLNEIYKHNPLLYDFVLKRTLKSPKTGRKFKDRVFINPIF